MKLGKNRRKTLASQPYFLGNDEITDMNSLTKQLLILIDHQQSLTSSIFGIKQANIHPIS
jgi:hypothetical protein